MLAQFSYWPVTPRPCLEPVRQRRSVRRSADVDFPASCWRQQVNERVAVSWQNQETKLILITVKTKVKPGSADAYLAANRPFLEATRQEPGNKWYEHFRSVDDPDTILTWRRSTTRRLARLTSTRTTSSSFSTTTRQSRSSQTFQTSSTWTSRIGRAGTRWRNSERLRDRAAQLRPPLGAGVTRTTSFLVSHHERSGRPRLAEASNLAFSLRPRTQREPQTRSALGR